MRKIVFLYTIIFFSFSSFSQEKPKEEHILTSNFSPGFYKKEIKVYYSSNQPDGKIYYTTDGSPPSFRSRKFKDSLSIKKTTVVRVAMYFNGEKVSEVSNTFLINTNHSLPVVSISTAPENLWGEEKGIYIKGCCASEFPPYRGANFWSKREITGYVEYFTEEKDQVVNQELGIRIFGGFTRSLEQKSLALIARKKYGNNKIDYPFFKSKPDIKQFKSVVLRNSGGDFNKSNFRDGLLTHLATETGLVTQAFQPVVVYINGEYWGIQNLREKITEHFIEDNFEVDKDSVDILRHRYDVQHGSSKEYHKLLSYIKRNDFSSNEKINELDKKIDIDNYLNYHISEIYFDNQDMSGNTRYWKKKSEEGRWSWLLFDTDLSFSISGSKGYKTNTLEQFTTYSDEKWPNPHWATFIIRKLLMNDSIKQVYITKTLDFLNTCYSSQNVQYKMDSIANLIESEVPDHSLRWSRKTKYWHKTLDVMRGFAENRPFYLRKHLQKKFELKDTCVVEIKNNTSFGSVSFNSINNISNFLGVYFTEIPYKLKVVPNPDYEFLGFEGNIIPKENESIVLGSSIKLVPIYSKKPFGKNHNIIIINELCVKNTQNKSDWIELYNTGDSVFNLDGWKIYSKKGVDTIKDKKIYPKGFIVLRQKEDFWFNIGSKSDSVKIYDESGLLVDAFYISNNQKQTNATYALRSPFHNRKKQESWTFNYKTQTPNKENVFFEEMIKTENAYSGILNIGAIAVLILGGGLLFVSTKKRPSESSPEAESIKKQHNTRLRE